MIIGKRKSNLQLQALPDVPKKESNVSTSVHAVRTLRFPLSAEFFESLRSEGGLNARLCLLSTPEIS